MPAINPGISVSRVGGSAQLKPMKKVSGELKLLYSQYRELQAFAQFGSDLDADTKSRLALGETHCRCFKANRNAPVPVACQVAIIYAVIHGYLNDIRVDQVTTYETDLYALLKSGYHNLYTRLNAGFFEEEGRQRAATPVGRNAEVTSVGANMKALRSRIKSVESTQHLVKAMGLVASSKIRRASDAMSHSRQYKEAVQDITGCSPILRSADALPTCGKQSRTTRLNWS